MSLREKKKMLTRDAILDAAEDLFADQGYGQTTIEQIAERAMVAVGTVYNYFDSKAQLLLAMNERDTRDLLEKGDPLVEDEEQGPAEACASLLWTYMEAFLRKYDRPLLREMWAAAVSEGPELTREFMGQDELLIAQLARLLETHQERGELAPSLPIDRAAWMLYGGVSSTLIAYLMYEETDLSAVREQIDEMVALAFRDWTTDS
jgi:AcrR family transcriptional regulator